MVSKLIKFSEKTGPLVEITIKKGKKTNISWGCLSAQIEAKIALTHAAILLKEENLELKEDILEDEKSLIDGACEEI